MNDFLNATLANGEGKYLVPTPLATQIIDNVYKGSALLQLLRKWPMSSITEDIPLLSTGSTAAYTSAEGAAKTNTQPAFGRVTLTAKELAAVTVTTELLLKTSNIANIAQIVQDDIVAAIIKAKELEYFGYGGSVYTYDLTNNTPGAHTVAWGAGADGLIDISDAISTLEEHGYTNLAMITHPAAKKNFRNLRTTDGVPLLMDATANSPATLFGYPIYYSPNMEKTGSPSAYEMFIADWSKVIEGNLSGMQIAKSSEASIVLADASTVNLFQQNMVAIKAWIYSAFTVADLNCLAKVTGL